MDVCVWISVCGWFNKGTDCFVKCFEYPGWIEKCTENLDRLSKRKLHQEVKLNIRNRKPLQPGQNQTKKREIWIISELKAQTWDKVAVVSEPPDPPNWRGGGGLREDKVQWGVFWGSWKTHSCVYSAEALQVKGHVKPSNTENCQLCFRSITQSPDGTVSRKTEIQKPCSAEPRFIK